MFNDRDAYTDVNPLGIMYDIVISALYMTIVSMKDAKIAYGRTSEKNPARTVPEPSLFPPLASV